MSMMNLGLCFFKIFLFLVEIEKLGVQLLLIFNLISGSLGGHVLWGIDTLNSMFLIAIVCFVVQGDIFWYRAVG